MQTRCPHCDTTFRVTPEDLQAAGGHVRCGHCYGAFYAADHEIPEKKLGSTFNRKPAAPAPSAPKEALREELLQEIQNREPPQKSGFGFLLGLLTSLLLITTLIAQYAYFNREQLAQVHQFRPWIEKTCAVVTIPCYLPMQKAPEHIRLVNREVMGKPGDKKVLLVKGTLRNEANFTQTFPVLELKLHDARGIPMFARRFFAPEYLSNPDHDLKDGFKARQSIPIQLELVDPGSDAVGFEFSFL